MKILQFILPVGMGGVERIAVDIHNYLCKNGEESYLAVSKRRADELIQYHYVYKKSHLIIINDDSIVSLLFSIKRIINSINPDIIHTHARRECFFVSLLDSKAIHIRTQHMSEKHRIPVTKFECVLYREKIHKWVATSNTLLNEYLKSTNFIKNDNATVIYNGVSPGCARRLKWNQSQKYCIISRLTKQKGIDILINKISLMPKCSRDKIKIDIYGEGEEKENIISLIHDRNLNDTIKYMGTTKNSAEVLVNYDALLMPSRYEGLPLTMLESMAIGVPVAIHNVGCISEIIISERNGWIINGTNGWEEFFRNIIMCDYESVSLSAFKTYINNFTTDKMCECYFKLYQEIKKI